MKDFEQAKEAFAYKYAEPQIIWNDGDVSICPDGEKIASFLSDLNSLLEQHKEVIFTAQQSKMPTKEMIEQYFNNHFDCYTDVTLDEYDTTEQAMTKDAVLKMFEWLRNQITEKK